MSVKFAILRRSQSERDIFGGEVYIDVDGRNVGTVGDTDFFIDLAEGQHKLKMYKSHTMGTFIGMAESDLFLSNGEMLVATYAPPMLVNQSGVIIISSYQGQQDLDQMAFQKENQLNCEQRKEEEKKRQQVEQSEKNNTTLFLWIFVIPVVLGLIYWISIMSTFDVG